MQHFRLTFKAALQSMAYAVRTLYLLLIDLPLQSFGRGYGRASRMLNWTAVRAKALDYWAMLWHIFGWFVGTIFPGPLLYGLIMTAWILLWAAAILAVPVWIGMAIWQALR